MSEPSDPALERALDELFAAPFPDFVAERKRLAGELRKAGHRAAATAIGKVNRPSLSCWTINQLVRRDLHELDALFSAAHRVRLGDFAATADHRTLLARLQHRALELLREAGQPTSDATLRRIATTLAALAARGGFAPDIGGRMIEDRDPPGFDSMDLFAAAGAAPALHLSVVPAHAEPPPHAPAEPARPEPTRTHPHASTEPHGADPSVEPPTELNPDEPSALDEPRAKPRFTLVPMPPASAPASVSASAPVSASSSVSDSASVSVPVSAPVSVSDSASAPVSVPVSAPVSVSASAPASVSASVSASATPLDEATLLAQAEAEAAHAAAQLAAAQAAAKAAAARVHLARQRTQLETLRAKYKRLASAIHDHEQAILQLQRDLAQRQTLLLASRKELLTLETELAAMTQALEPTSRPPDDTP